MHKPSRWTDLAGLRRISQICFFLLFLFLLLHSELPRSIRPGSTAGERLPYPVALFLQADPLAAITTALSTHALYRGMLWSLLILIPTFFLGRFFCGWICPLGSLHHFFSNLKSETKRGRHLIELSHYQPWQAWKYYLLVAILVAALCGSAIGGLLDPISMTVRSLGLAVLPAVNYGVNAGPQIVAGALQFLLGGMLISFKQPHFRQGFFLGALFIVLMVLNLRVTRFWCRALCPLGALLGWASRWSLLGLEKRTSLCNDCNRCLVHCQGGDDPMPGTRWRKAECHLCFNCVTDCPESGLAFRFFPTMADTAPGPDLRRRRILAGLAGGAALVPMLRATPGLTAERNERLIRPPGALSEKSFLERCVRCGECMKTCPNNSLHPTLMQAGLEGTWTPVLVPRIGYCEPSCVLCGQVCPTGAIWEISAKEKAWVVKEASADAQPVRLGLAFYDRGRCLPWAMATECIVCEEWCPVTPKAIYLRPAEVFDRDGKPKQVRQPYVDPERCVGCGACEFACPVQDRPAIYVTTIGESRAANNQLLLKRGLAPAVKRDPFPATGDVPGWSKSGATRSFAAADLGQYIDGDAEKYIRAGVQRTQTADYRYRDSLEATVDIHTMSMGEGARKLFEDEPAAHSKAIPLGDAARSYGAVVTFHKGIYFVRLVAYQETPQTPEALAVLARAIEGRLS